MRFGAFKVLPNIYAAKNNPSKSHIWHSTQNLSNAKIGQCIFFLSKKISRHKNQIKRSNKKWSNLKKKRKLDG